MNRPSLLSRAPSALAAMVAIAIGFGMEQTLALDAGLKSYYFKQGELCVALIDFEPEGAQLAAMPAELRETTLVNAVLDDYRLRGAKECNGTKLARLIAVRIPGVDSYGRPAFGSRVNLLQIEGAIDALTAIASSPSRDVTKLSQLTITRY
jgi:hypothetical protein